MQLINALNVIVALIIKQNCLPPKLAYDEKHLNYAKVQRTPFVSQCEYKKL